MTVTCDGAVFTQFLYDVAQGDTPPLRPPASRGPGYHSRAPNRALDKYVLFGGLFIWGGGGTFDSGGYVDKLSHPVW